MNPLLRSDTGTEAAERFVLTPDSPTELVARGGGGKARSLHALSRAGIAVPPWIAFSAELFRTAARASGLEALVQARLAALTEANLEAVAGELEAAVLAADGGPDLSGLVERTLARLGGGPVAVRSSGLEEDGAAFSFAGQFSTFLNVRGADEVARCVRACWASSYSARSLRYRLAHGLPLGFVDVAVIVQRMVPAEKSGVIFTANPVARRLDQLVISSVYGLGEGLVSGAIDADTVILDRATRQIVEQVEGDKREAYECAPDRDGWIARAVEPARRDGLSLTTEEIEQLRATGEVLEALFGGPQDIEWAIAGGTLHILQSRPITTLRARRRGPDRRIWDNSNISESYADLTSPLTFSFASHIYHRVYREYCRLLGVPRRQMEEMDDWLRSMLGQHHGRVYYNLLNWYKVVRLVPFYELNRKMLDLMIGSESLDDATAESLYPFTARTKAEELAIRARAALLFGWHFVTVERIVNRFVDRFHRVHPAFDAIDYDELAPEEVYARFLEARRELTDEWGRTILLEQTVGLACGALHIMIKRWLPDAPDNFFYEATRMEAPIDSLAPVERLSQLAELVRRDPALAALVRETPPAELPGRLARAGEPAAAHLRAEVDRYIREFGYRSLNELKLEEPDLREDPSVLFAMLKSVLDQPPPPQRAAARAQDGRRLHGGKLRGWRRAAFELVRRKVVRTIAARERIRFCRTRAFGTTRRMMRALGRRLAEGGVLRAPEDVFFLRLEELMAVFEGRTPAAELAPAVEARRRRRTADAALDPPARFTTQGLILDGDLREAGWSAKDAGPAPAATGPLRGTPCSPGVARGVAAVVTEPLDVGGKVLVTYRTDPGWCAVLPSACALIIERGSPLTHVAVVARELGIPTVMQLRDATRLLRSGMQVVVDGTTGVVTIERAPAEADASGSTKAVTCT